MSIYRLSFQTRGEEGNGHRGSNWEPTSFRHSLLPRSCTQREITRTWCHVVQRVTLYSVCLLHSGPRQHATTDVEGEEREKKRNVNDGVIVCLHVTHVVSGKVLWRHAFSSAISCTCPSTCYLHTPGCTFKSADTPTALSSPPLPHCATRKTTTMLTSDPRSPFPSRPFCFIFFFFLLRRWKCYLSAGVQVLLLTCLITVSLTFTCYYSHIFGPPFLFFCLQIGRHRSLSISVHFLSYANQMAPDSRTWASRSWTIRTPERDKLSAEDSYKPLHT